MNKAQLNKYIVADPAICHGKPTFKGTRVMVWQVLELLEEGESFQEIYKAYPNLPKGAIKSALHYAAEKAKKASYAPFKQTFQSQVSA